MPSASICVSSRISTDDAALAGDGRPLAWRTRAASARCPARWRARAPGCCTRRAAVPARPRLERVGSPATCRAGRGSTIVHDAGGAGADRRSCSCRRRTRRASAPRRPPARSRDVDVAGRVGQARAEHERRCARRAAAAPPARRRSPAGAPRSASKPTTGPAPTSATRRGLPARVGDRRDEQVERLPGELFDDSARRFRRRRLVEPATARRRLALEPRNDEQVDIDARERSVGADIDAEVVAGGIRLLSLKPGCAAHAPARLQCVQPLTARNWTMTRPTTL